jgi:hypothetical protein
MKKFLCLALLSSVVAMNSYAFNLQPKSHISFSCSQPSLDANDLMANNGTDTMTIQKGMTNWVNGMPQPGCTQQTINEITQNGYFCDGHFLGDYKQDQEVDYYTVAACETARAAQPAVDWN